MPAKLSQPSPTRDPRPFGALSENRLRVLLDQCLNKEAELVGVDWSELKEAQARTTLVLDEIVRHRGIEVASVARRMGMSRQAVHKRLRKYWTNNGITYVYERPRQW